MTTDENRIINRKLAEKYYKRALKCDPNDTNTLFKYAIFLTEDNLYETAEDQFILSLKADPNHLNAAIYYLNMLSKWDSSIKAKEFFKEPKYKAILPKVLQQLEKKPEKRYEHLPEFIRNLQKSL